MKQIPFVKELLTNDQLIEYVGDHFQLLNSSPIKYLNYYISFMFYNTLAGLLFKWYITYSIIINIIILLIYTYHLSIYKIKTKHIYNKWILIIRNIKE